MISLISPWPSSSISSSSLLTLSLSSSSSSLSYMSRSAARLRPCLAVFLEDRLSSGDRTCRSIGAVDSIGRSIRNRGPPNHPYPQARLGSMSKWARVIKKKNQKKNGRANRTTAGGRLSRHCSDTHAHDRVVLLLLPIMVWSASWRTEIQGQGQDHHATAGSIDLHARRCWGTARSKQAVPANSSSATTCKRAYPLLRTAPTLTGIPPPIHTNNIEQEPCAPRQKKRRISSPLTWAGSFPRRPRRTRRPGAYWCRVGAVIVVDGPINE